MINQSSPYTPAASLCVEIQEHFEFANNLSIVANTPFLSKKAHLCL